MADPSISMDSPAAGMPPYFAPLLANGEYSAGEFKLLDVDVDCFLVAAGVDPDSGPRIATAANKTIGDTNWSATFPMTTAGTNLDCYADLIVGGARKARTKAVGVTIMTFGFFAPPAAPEDTGSKKGKAPAGGKGKGEAVKAAAIGKLPKFPTRFRLIKELPPVARSARAGFKIGRRLVPPVFDGEVFHRETDSGAVTTGVFEIELDDLAGEIGWIEIVVDVWPMGSGLITLPVFQVAEDPFAP